MPAIRGILGGESESVRRLEALGRPSWGMTSEYVDDGLGVVLESHESRGTSQPRAVEGESGLLWVLGEIYGHFGPNGYRPRPDGTSSVAYATRLYDRFGPQFVDRLNGQFVLLIYDRVDQTVSLATDRLGSQAVFLAGTDDGHVFSTQIQEIPLHPSVEPDFVDEYLFEYLVFRRVFGTRTPLRGVEKVPPATVLTVDLVDGTRESRRYWEPRFEPRSESFEWFVDRFVETFETVLSEWIDPGREYGVLLSGGSDSRLVLAGLEGEATAYHLSDWSNTEATRSQESARTVGARFEPLIRDSTYYQALLDQNAPLSNFDGYFFQGYAMPFAQKIQREVDALLSGLYADTLFKRQPLPQRQLPLGPLGSATLPIGNRIESVDELLDWWFADAPGTLPEPPAYLDVDGDMRSILERNIGRTEDGIVHHGVRYNSMRDLVVSHLYYPLSNDTELIFTNSLRQIRPYRTPFLDARLVDLHLQYPLTYRLRRNIIHRAVERLESDLAAIPHANTGVPLSRHSLVHILSKNVDALAAKFARGTETDPEYLTQGSWRDRSEFIRCNDFVPAALADGDDLLTALPQLDRVGALDTLEEHLSGGDNTAVLYTLLTLLNMPIVGQMVDPQTPAPPRPAEPVLDPRGRSERRVH